MSAAWLIGPGLTVARAAAAEDGEPGSRLTSVEQASAPLVRMEGPGSVDEWRHRYLRSLSMLAQGEDEGALEALEALERSVYREAGADRVLKLHELQLDTVRRLAGRDRSWVRAVVWLHYRQAQAFTAREEYLLQRTSWLVAAALTAAPYRVVVDLGLDNVAHRVEVIAIDVSGARGAAAVLTAPVPLGGDLSLSLQQLYVTAHRSGEGALDLGQGTSS